MAELRPAGSSARDRRLAIVTAVASVILLGVTALLVAAGAGPAAAIVSLGGIPLSVVGLPPTLRLAIALAKERWSRPPAGGGSDG